MTAAETRSRRLPAPLAAVFALVLAASAQAKDLDQLSMYVGYPPGGSFDAYVRTMAKHLTRHLPGNPTIIVKYMPGGGSRKLADYLYKVAAKDGSEFGQLNRSILFTELLTGEKEVTDVRELAYIGSPTSESQNCVVWHGSSIQTLDDARNRDVPISVTGPASSDIIALTVANKLIGTRFKPISGYQGGSEQNLAMERGETDGRCWTYGTALASRSDWVRDKKVRFIFQASITKHPDLPDVPLLIDRVTDPLDREALKLVFADQETGHPIVAPPGTDPAMVAKLQQAFEGIMKDPAFLADAETAKLTIAPISGARLEEIVRAAYAQPKQVIDRARSLGKVD